MYGIETINTLNRKNAEAEAIVAKHAESDAAKAAAQSVPVQKVPAQN